MTASTTPEASLPFGPALPLAAGERAWVSPPVDSTGASAADLRVVIGSPDGTARTARLGEGPCWSIAGSDRAATTARLAVRAQCLGRIDRDFLAATRMQVARLLDTTNDVPPLRLEAREWFRSVQLRARIGLDREEARSRALIKLRAFDAEGNSVELPRLTRSPSFGDQYLYVKIPEARGQTHDFRHVIDLPPDVVRLEAELAHFAGKPALAVLEELSWEPYFQTPSTAIIEADDFDPDLDVLVETSVEGTETPDLRLSVIDPLARPHDLVGATSELDRGRELRTLHRFRSDGFLGTGPAVLHVPSGGVGLSVRQAPAVAASVEQLTTELGSADRAARHKGIAVVYTTAGPFADDVLRLRSHYIAEQLADAGYLVLYCPFASKLELGEVRPNLFQIPRNIAPKFIERLQSLENFSRRIFFCSTQCDALVMLNLDTLRLAGWKVVFEVRDDMEGMALAGFGKWYSPVLENRMYARSDLVFCVSRPLVERALARGAPTSNTYLCKNGIAADLLSRARDIRAAARPLREARRQVGYFGHMFGKRFDRDLVLRHATDTRKHYHLIGPGLQNPEDFLELGTVRCDDRMAIDEFMLVSAGWKVAVLPFVDNRLTRSLDPIKQYLYLALGMSIVAAPVYEMRELPATRIFRNDREYADAVADALADQDDPFADGKIDALLDSSTWERRAAEQMAVIEKVAA